MVNKLHWLAHRIVDPIGKLMHDMDYLAFRRTLLLAMAHDEAGWFICLHDACADKFRSVDFFNLRGGDHPLRQVGDGAAARAIGAQGFLCQCPRTDQPAMKRHFEVFPNVE
mgnify:CR=1 FL=1